MSINLLKIGFILMVLFIVTLGGLINTVEKHIPPFITQLYRYGKFSYKGKSTFIKPLEVPKRWFRHFYIFAAVNTSLATFFVFNLYFLRGKQHPWILFSLDLLATSERRAMVNATSTFIALTLLTVQSWHRFYETWFISIFSNSQMNVSHYLVGYIHYFGSVAAILSESPGFISSGERIPEVGTHDLTFLSCFACVLFLWACHHQCKAGIILANLRKNSEGQVISMKHSIPQGHWFELVSSPHLLAEILMYLSLTIILWGATIWPVVFLWVLFNQVESALLTHWWYKSTFKNYPRERKAIIPLVL